MEIKESEHAYFIRIDPKHSDFRDQLKIVSHIKGTKYHEAIKTWSLQKLISRFKDLQELEQYLVDQMYRVKLAKQSQELFKEVELPDLDPGTIIPLKHQMYPFQAKGVAYSIDKGSTFMADQQGLGKTIQAIAAVVAMDAFPCLVICKANLVHNWKAEWDEWSFKRSFIYKHSIRNAWPTYFQVGVADVGIVNYEGLEKYFVDKIQIPDGERFSVKHIILKEAAKMFKSVIVDESQYVKDTSTKRTKFCVAICRNKPHVFCLSGTPALNDGKEIYPQLCMMNKEKLFAPNMQTFMRQFSGKKNKNNLKLLNGLMKRHCFYRRVKSDVLPDLPAKTRQKILVDITNREEYELAENQFRKYLQESLKLTHGQITQKMRGEALVQTGILKKLSAQGKIEAIIEWANSLIEEGEKVVLFAFHKEIQKNLLDGVDAAIALSYGITDREIRNSNKKQFQENSKVRAIICSNSADAEGHTLTAASYLGGAELPWHFGKMEQMEDRIHRIGTEYPVNCGWFIGKDTVDEKIWKIIVDKREMHKNITGSDDEAPDQIIDLFIHMMAKKEEVING
jgi:SWI/SNF-related matrix-associated actin-dependent regulator 1 of chromatin subfamily A